MKPTKSSEKKAYRLSKTTLTKEPRNTLYVQRWADLPALTDMAEFAITNTDGNSHSIHINKNTRRVFEALWKSPIYCASRCRISHYVNLLRHEYNVEIETDRYSNDPDTGRLTYGVFRLVSKVRRIQSSGV
ncbi:hypothetical protein [Ruegeria sp. HKCCSA071]|uniref:hypothetical protein n=1 Tax=Ruegeria sp. HKCCSA071 TaxID=2794834 RepID=UPI001AEB5041|nr:hypothetical protein [Ruegeria sp. HKCCSA071]